MLRWLRKVLGKEVKSKMGLLDANEKVQFDNLVSHEKMVMSYEELALKQAVENQDLITKENNRYLLDFLLSIYPSEAIGLSTLYSSVASALSKNQDFVNSVASKMAQTSTQ
jgi:hypothetical protein